MHEAMLYEALEDGRVRCHLCAHRCTIAVGRPGICDVRQNIDGKLITQIYGRVVSQHLDPIEKKPLYHFYPGSTAYSIATRGCNFKCPWCQNWAIAEAPEQYVPWGAVSPEQVVMGARASGSQSIAYTYTEPTIFFEYALDVAMLARDAGLSNIYVTNGYMTSEMLDFAHPYIDAANVDLKAFRDRSYRKYAGARLQPVLDSLKQMRRLDIWLEVTTLVIPCINDDPSELRALAAFIATELGVDTPWHVTRFHPARAMQNVAPTPLETLQRAYEAGRDAGLHYIYLGNVPSDLSADTVCPGCDRTVIRRRGFSVTRNDVHGGQCPHCQTVIAGVGMG